MSEQPDKLILSKLGECLIVDGYDNRVVVVIQVLDEHLILTKEQRTLILTGIENRYNVYPDQQAEIKSATEKYAEEVRFNGELQKRITDQQVEIERLEKIQSDNYYNELKRLAAAKEAGAKDDIIRDNEFDEEVEQYENP